MNTFINAVVRLEQGKPIIFWYDSINSITSYSNRDMHCTASKDYMYSLKLASNDIAESYIKYYNERYQEHARGWELKLSKQLKY